MHTPTVPRSTIVAAASVVLATGVGLLVGLLLGNPLPGAAFGLGLLLGGVGSILAIPALRGTPAGVRGAAIDDAVTGWAEFHRELARARRFDGTFAIIRLSPGAIGSEELVALRNEIAAGSRRIDRLWIDHDDLLMVLPETTQATAETAMARIRSAVGSVAGLEPRIAMFPEHGITSGALIAAVYGSSQEDVPTPIASIRPSPLGIDLDATVSALDVLEAPDSLVGQSG